MTTLVDDDQDSWNFTLHDDSEENVLASLLVARFNVIVSTTVA